MSSSTYTCDFCGGTFEKGWSDEEAEAEAIRDYGTPMRGQRANACDDCYQEIRRRQAAAGGAMNPAAGKS